MDILEIIQRAADGADAFAMRLADGWYPSGRNDEGEHVHDRHVMIHVRNHAHDLHKAAKEIERLHLIIHKHHGMSNADQCQG